MGELERKGIREVSSWAIGIAATAFTALASLLGALHELGYMGGKQAAPSAPVAVVTVVAAPQQAAPGEGEMLPHHRRHHPMPAAADSDATNQQLVSNAAPAAPAVVPPSIDGAWRDAFLGACHLITQKGNLLTIVNYNPFNGHESGIGEGTYTNGVIHLRFKNHKGEMIAYEFQLGPAGKRMVGTVQGLGDTRRAQWHYAGPSCAK
jgi:hypothetical protein